MPENPENEGLWESHASELKRLREEVDTLLEAARWESGEAISLNEVEINLEDWLQSALPRWKIILGPDAVLTRVGPPLKCHAIVDLRILNLITDNLIDNARKFSKNTPHITLKTEIASSKIRWQKQKWKLQVCDQGWGFTPEDGQKIFKRFYRSKNLAPHSIAGNGLGLHLAASAAKALKMHLSGESEGPGRGATFTLEGYTYAPLQPEQNIRDSHSQKKTGTHLSVSSPR